MCIMTTACTCGTCGTFEMLGRSIQLCTTAAVCGVWRCVSDRSVHIEINDTQGQLLMRLYSLQTYPELGDSSGCLSPGSFLTCSSDNTIRLWKSESPQSHGSGLGLRHNLYSQVWTTAGLHWARTFKKGFILICLNNREHMYGHEKPGKVMKFSFWRSHGNLFHKYLCNRTCLTLPEFQSCIVGIDTEED